MAPARTAMAAAAALVALYALAVLTEVGQRWDQAAMQGAAAAVADQRWAETVTTWVSPGGVALAAIGVAVATAAVRGVLVALAGSTVTVTAVVCAQLLKPLLERPDLLADASANSFPSGHVAAVAGLAAAVLVAVPAGARPVLATLAAAPVLVTGAATVVLGWHRPSDVLGAALLAVMLGGLGSSWADGASACRGRDGSTMLDTPGMPLGRGGRMTR